MTKRCHFTAALDPYPRQTGIESGGMAHPALGGGLAWVEPLGQSEGTA